MSSGEALEASRPPRLPSPRRRVDGEIIGFDVLKVFGRRGRLGLRPRILLQVQVALQAPLEAVPEVGMGFQVVSKLKFNGREVTL